MLIVGSTTPRDWLIDNLSEEDASAWTMFHTSIKIINGAFAYP